MMKGKVQPVAYAWALAVGSHNRPGHITPLHILCWTWLEEGDGETQGMEFPTDSNIQPKVWHLHLRSPSPVQHSLRLLVSPGASRSCHCLDWASERALASKHLLFLPGCATLFSVLREWKRHTRASLPSSGKELFEPRKVTTNSVPHQLVQTEVVKILNKTICHWSGHSLVL